jgi:hypothetical protein
MRNVSGRKIELDEIDDPSLDIICDNMAAIPTPRSLEVIP